MDREQYLGGDTSPQPHETPTEQEFPFHRTHKKRQHETLALYFSLLYNATVMTTNDYKQNSGKSSNLEKMRHSMSHILAQAVLRVYPDAKLGIGPAVENGFYYEFEINEDKNKIDLAQIEKEMHKIKEEELPINQTIISREEAFDMLHLQGQIYKTELLQEIPDEEISFFKTGEEFIDLCRGPHVSHTGKIGAFKLTGIKEVYWRNDENRPQLYKIEGLGFETEEELDNFMKWEEEKYEKEHKYIGPRRKYFSLSEKTGVGLPFWLEEGIKVKNIIKKFLTEERLKKGYIEVKTPSISKVSLFKETGHLEFYQDLDLKPFEIDDELYMLRPMATPSHIEIYRNQRRGYSNLPYKIFEFAELFRDEAKDELQGLVRTREFTQDAAHVFTTEDQAQEEVEQLIKFTIYLLKSFGFKDFSLEFARRDPNKMEDYLGDDKTWNQAESILIKALEETKLVAREAIGEAEFYGPKIDFRIKDIFGKDWQVATIHMDLVIPERTKLEFINSKGKEETPFLIHHSAIGSIERFFALLVEYHAGALPLWLAPAQVSILSVSENQIEYAEKVKNELEAKKIRVQLDNRPLPLQTKVHDAQMIEIPYMIVVGKQEETSDVVSVRQRTGEDLGIMKISEFIEVFQDKLQSS